MEHASDWFQFELENVDDLFSFFCCWSRWMVTELIKCLIKLSRSYVGDKFTKWLDRDEFVARFQRPSYFSLIASLLLYFHYFYFTTIITMKNYFWLYADINWNLDLGIELCVSGRWTGEWGKRWRKKPVCWV